VTLPVHAVESLLDTKYYIYEHEDGSYIVRAPVWSLPVHLHDHIDAVQPTTSFFKPKAFRSNVKPINNWKHGIAVSEMTATEASSTLSVEKACNVSAVTSKCLRTLYDTINYTPQVPGKNKVGLNDFLGESNNRSDIEIFLKMQRPDAVSEAYSFKFEVIAGGSDQQSPDNATQLAAGTDLEGNLDAETLIGIDYPTPLIAFTTGGSPPFIPDINTPTDTNEPYLTWLTYVLAQPASALPQTISTSYGDDEQSVPKSYATKVCNEFAQLGARGISLIFASGDDGVGPNGTCFSNDGKNTSTFLPEFPAACPYVTTVGATKNVNPEIVAIDPENGFVSGGGFSNYFPRPSYQDPIVPNYVESLGNEYKGLYNPNGRGYPDIAAQGYHFVTIWNGSVAILDGTSCATPTAAGVISLVNDALIAAGKSPLGFLNPWLYSGAYKAFTDITIGSSVGCDTAGFPAKVGWDAVTGFGTPYFPKIKAYALEGDCE
jgi:tripeptidyl-peptidase-1